MTALTEMTYMEDMGEHSQKGMSMLPLQAHCTE